MRGALGVILVVVAVLATGCGGASDGAPAGSARITVWISENQPDRVAAMKENVADFTRRTGVQVELGVLADDELAPRMAAAAEAGALPDVVQVSMADAHAYVQEGILDADAAQETVRALDEATFSSRALSLLTTEGRVAAVPSDGWGQLLIYRKDLFDAAGLDAPRSLADVVRAARRLRRGGMAGITLATAVGDGFTAETFEHVALASGCQLVDDAGEVALDSRPCRDAFATYAELARLSPRAEQDVDTTRDTYFAGRAAMIFWSPFLLDAMAGLRDDARPTCPQCEQDPAYLARNSGLVGALVSPVSGPAQYGNISTWGITRGGDLAGAKRFVRYIMSDGYVRWLALSPQGKYPVRAGDRADSDRFVREWSELESGVERRAPLRRYYSRAAIDSLGEGVRSFRRWGFEQDQAALVGELSEDLPVVGALVRAIQGELTPAQAARRAAAAVRELQRD